MSAKRQSHPQRSKRADSKSVSKQGGAPEVLSTLRKSIDARWRQLSPGLASLVAVGGGKIGDVYSVVARFVSEHAEAFQDRLAERRVTTEVPPSPSPAKKSVPRARSRRKKTTRARISPVDPSAGGNHRITAPARTSKE